MQYQIQGETLPVVICQLSAGERMITEGGGMAWMSPNMKMETTSNGGLGRALGRMFSGEKLFQNIYTAQGAWPYAMLIVVSILNYLIFFWSDLMYYVRRQKRSTSRGAMNFKRAAEAKKQQTGYLHKCAVCGRTDTDYPNLEFRYCSKCVGNYCYCMDHINNHVHITQ